MKVSDTRNGIFAGGNFITDYAKVIDVWPKQDTLALIQSESMSNGGGPYNVLKDLSRLSPNLPLQACGLIGTDSNGDWILQDCQRSGIDVSQISRSEIVPTSYTDAMTVETTGRRTFFHQPGANALLAPEHFDFSKTSAKIFVLGYLMLLDVLDSVDTDGVTGSEKVLREARRAGLITAVDCVSVPHSGFKDIVHAALRETDILFLNEFEIGQVLGREVLPCRESMLEAALELANSNFRKEIQVVLHSAEGAIVAMGDGSWKEHPAIAMPSSEIAGATGAGDAFSAGYLLGIHEGLEISDCLHFAVSAAAMSLCHYTPSLGIGTLQECLDLGKRHGFRDF